MFNPLNQMLCKMLLWASTLAGAGDASVVPSTPSTCAVSAAAPQAASPRVALASEGAKKKRKPEKKSPAKGGRAEGETGGEAQAPAPAGPLSAAQVAARVQAFYDKTRTYKARFEQSQLNATFGRTRKSSGEVMFVKPGKMRWNYAEPSKKTFVSDGKILWLYEPADKQAFKQPLETSQLPAALAFLMGEGKLTEAFDIERAQSLNYGRPGDHRLSLTPKEPQAQYKAIYFIIDPESFEVRQTVLVDAQGNINDITFENAKTNVRIRPSTFKWKPPRGVRVVDAASLGGR